MALWTPAEITTALWLDASDSGTITLNGSTVSQWDDKSGNSNHAVQATASIQPAIDASTLGGLQSLSLSAGKRMTLTSAVTIGTEHTVFSVIRRATASTHMIPLGSDSSGGYPFYWYTDNYIYIEFGLNPLQRANLGTITGNFLLCGQRSGSTLTAWKDGTAMSTTDSSSLGGTTYSQVGARQIASSEFTDGLIGEIIAVSGALSVGTRQLIEGYLAWKWGTTAALPADHPYKSAAPTLHKVSGTVTVNGSPAARTVAVFRRSDFTLLGTTTSNATTGAFEILNDLIPADANALLVTAIDSTGTYNAVSVDYITSVA